MPSNNDADRTAAHRPDLDATMVAPTREGPGTRIGPYKILQLIGEGGFGSVFMAEQEQPVRRSVALKIIKLGMDTRQVVARFEQERQALAMMDHPNIARVLDAGATETGRPYFVMDLVKGEPIAEYCDKNNLSIHERLELFAQVCGAVQHAHTKGIIHRDIKPSNILVSTQDGRPCAKVIDFGIAKATASRLTEKTLFTEHRQLIGTPEYMSPEQAEGSMDIDTRTDVYSLGVLLYELLTGTTPFSSNELRSAAYAEIQRIIREVDPPVPSTRLSRNGDTLAGVAAHRHTEPRKLGTLIRGELDWIVMKALEKDRSRRYETANGLAQDVRRYLSGDAVLAAPPSGAYRLRKLVGRHRAAVGAGGAVCASLLVGAVAFAWQARVAIDQRDRAIAAEATSTQRADELQKLADFQSSMLSQIDASSAGEELMADLHARFGAALESAGVDIPERQARTASLAGELARVNATDAAAAMIHRTVLSPSAKAIDEKFKDQPAVGATLRHTLAELYRVLGRNADALPLETAALETRRRVLGDDSRGTIDSLGSLAQLLESENRLDEAEAASREAFERSRRVLGADDPLSIDMTLNLGFLLRTRAKYDEAEPLLREALETSRRVRGNAHRSTLAACNVYGYLLLDQGKTAEAERYWREAYETGKRAFGTSDPDVFVWTNNMGGLLDAQGRSKESEAFFREAYDASRRIRGDEHPQTITCLRNVGLSLKQQGRYPEARTIFAKTLEQRRRARGEDHPETIDSISDFGAVLQALGKADEAEPYYRECYAKSQAAYGKEHPKTLTALSNVAFLLKAQGKFDEAASLEVDVAATRRRVLGPDHPGTLVTESNLAMTLMDRKEFAEAESLGRSVLERRKRVLGPDHPDTLVSYNILSQILSRQNRPAEAEELCRAAYEAGVRVQGPDHPDTLIFAMNLGAMLLEADKPAEGEALLRDSLERLRRVAGPENTSSLVCASLLGCAIRAQHREAEAVALLAPIEPIARANFTGGNTRRLSHLLFALGASRATLATNAQERATAEANLVEAHGLYVGARGAASRYSRDCAKALADLYAAWHTADPTKGYDAKSAEWAAKTGG